MVLVRIDIGKNRLHNCVDIVFPEFNSLVTLFNNQGQYFIQLVLCIRFSCGARTEIEFYLSSVPDSRTAYQPLGVKNFITSDLGRSSMPSR